MDFINADEKIMDLTKGFMNFADGKLICDWFYDRDKPTFNDLINADLSLHKNIERNETPYNDTQYKIYN